MIDLGYYMLSNKHFVEMLPYMQYPHFETVVQIILNDNQIDDDGILELTDFLT